MPRRHTQPDSFLLEAGRQDNKAANSDEDGRPCSAMTRPRDSTGHHTHVRGSRLPCAANRRRPQLCHLSERLASGSIAIRSDESDDCPFCRLG